MEHTPGLETSPPDGDTVEVAGGAGNAPPPGVADPPNPPPRPRGLKQPPPDGDTVEVGGAAGTATAPGLPNRPSHRARRRLPFRTHLPETPRPHGRAVRIDARRGADGLRGTGR